MRNVVLPNVHVIKLIQKYLDRVKIKFSVFLTDPCTGFATTKRTVHFPL